jgi:hypothetical protein
VKGIFLVGVLGSAVGVTVGVLLGSRLVASPPVPKSSPGSEPLAAAAAPTVYVVDRPAPASGADDQLAARVASLEARLAPHDRPPPPDPSAALAEDEADRHRMMAAYEQQSRDTTWAPRAEAAFETDFGKLSNKGIVVRGVECRTTACKAELQWPSYANARRDAAQLVHFPFAENCARHTFTPPPEDPDKPYETTMLFECEMARSGRTGSAN